MRDGPNATINVNRSFELAVCAIEVLGIKD